MDALTMIFHPCLLLFFMQLISAERTFFQRHGKTEPVSFEVPKAANGVGFLQDLSSTRIISNEPFILSFELPKRGRSGFLQSAHYGTKRSKVVEKKNGQLRPYRQIGFLKEDLLNRKRRVPILRPQMGMASSDKGLANQNERRGKNLGNNFISTISENKPKLAIFSNTQNEPDTKEQSFELQKDNSNIIEEISMNKPDVAEDGESVGESEKQNQIKNRISYLSKRTGHEDIKNYGKEGLEKSISRKIWMNEEPLEFVNAPRRNPYFYKLLPENYPSIITSDEKQLECNKRYDIIDVARDKNMVSDKINYLEKVLTSDLEPAMIDKTSDMTLLPQPKIRLRRDIQKENVKSDKENTLQDESLQGKLEGEVRSDRSRRTKQRQRPRKHRQRTKGTNQITSKNTTPKPLSSTNDEPHKHPENEIQATQSTESTDTKAQQLKILNEVNEKLKTEGKDIENKMEKDKQEIKSPEVNILQEVFSPTEVNKVIKKKELEGNIFDKIVTAMKKYEDNNPYDDSFKPQKRESGNATHDTVGKEMASSNEHNSEVDDAVRKLAKIFKILGVKMEAKKKFCTDHESSVESSSVESGEDEKRTKKTERLRMSKMAEKCTCAEDCPLCQNCMKCFKECKKNQALKMSSANRQTAVGSTMVDEEGHLGIVGEVKLDATNDGFNTQKEANLEMYPQPTADGSMVHSNNIKIDRMYRSKLPPSRDLVRVYFDNPENKLLVWTKRGRRTMPWGPLASDLQLYRDRARQILKSAEDILNRIRDTEEKIHASGTSNDDAKTEVEKHKNESEMEEIIKKVVNEDDAKNILRTPWEAEADQINHVKTNIKDKGDTESDEEEITEITKESYREKEVNEGQSDRSVAEKSMKSASDVTDSSQSTSLESEETFLEKSRDKESSVTEESDIETSLKNDRRISESEEWHLKTSENRMDSLESPENVRETDHDEVEKASLDTMEDSYEGNVRPDENWMLPKAEVFSSEGFVNPEWDRENESKSIEAAVQSIEDNVQEPRMIDEHDVSENSSGSDEEGTHRIENDKGRNTMDSEKDEEDIPAKIEVINEKLLTNSEQNDELEKVNLMLKKNQELKEQNSQERDQTFEKDISEEDEEYYSDDVEQLKKDASDPEKSEENHKYREDQGYIYYEDSEEKSRDLTAENMKQRSGEVGEASREEGAKSPEVENKFESSGETQTEKITLQKEQLYKDDDKNIFQDKIKPLEENYIIKGVKKLKEEKEAILKALLNLEENGEDGETVLEKDQEEKMEITSEEAESTEATPMRLTLEKYTEGKEESESFRNLIDHLKEGQMDKDDFQTVKKLDHSKIDQLVEEMQKKDDKGQPVKCETRLKLCQVACGCNNVNGTITDVDKYDIMRSFLKWIKDVQIDQMVPISV